MGFDKLSNRFGKTCAADIEYTELFEGLQILLIKEAAIAMKYNDDIFTVVLSNKFYQVSDGLDNGVFIVAVTNITTQNRINGLR